MRGKLAEWEKLKPQTYRHTSPPGGPGRFGPGFLRIGEGGGGATDPLYLTKRSRFQSPTSPTGPLFALFVYFSGTPSLGFRGGGLQFPPRSGALLGPVLNSRWGLPLSLGALLHSPGLPLALKEACLGPGARELQGGRGRLHCASRSRPGGGGGRGAAPCGEEGGRAAPAEHRRRCSSWRRRIHPDLLRGVPGLGRFVVGTHTAFNLIFIFLPGASGRASSAAAPGWGVGGGGEDSDIYTGGGGTRSRRSTAH